MKINFKKMNMKKTVLVILISFISISGFSQTLLKIFENLPDKAIFLTRSERRNLINGKNQNELPCRFEVLDTKNGYLQIEGCMEGYFAMCYWNLKNGKKMVAVYQEGCGPVCYVEQFDFYEYDGKTFKHLDYASVLPVEYNDFLGSNPEAKIKEMEKKDITATLLFKLPRYGRNIIATWGNFEEQKYYRKYALGDKMKLIWNDGKFKKSRPYWSK